METTAALTSAFKLARIDDSVSFRRRPLKRRFSITNIGDSDHLQLCKRISTDISGARSMLILKEPIPSDASMNSIDHFAQSLFYEFLDDMILPDGFDDANKVTDPTAVSDLANFLSICPTLPDDGCTHYSDEDVPQLADQNDHGDQPHQSYQGGDDMEGFWEALFAMYQDMLWLEPQFDPTDDGDKGLDGQTPPLKV